MTDSADRPLETMPMLSVIVPVFNGAAHLSACLSALSADSSEAVEIIVVDDGSTDGSGDMAIAVGVKVLRLWRNIGASGARNRGSAVARAPLLLFLDSDVSIHPGTLDRVCVHFAAEPSVDAIFGSYDDAPSAPGLVSRYRNLLHHYTHQTGRREATTFWTGLGAVRRVAFEAIGGFDEQTFGRCGMEDIELGDRLYRSGRRIILDAELQCTHHKAWTLASMVRTDVLHRALPWSRLILARRSAPNDLNLRLDQRLCVVLALLFWLPLMLGFLSSPWWHAPALACWLAIMLLNSGLCSLFLRRHGVHFTLTASALQLLFHTYSGLSYLYALMEQHWQRLWMFASRRQHGAVGQ